MILPVWCTLILTLVSAATAASKQGRIIKGLPAKTGQFQHQIGLSIALPDKLTWCGGNLISDQWILTAAHCLNNFISSNVTLGSTDRLIAEQTFNITKANVTIHPQYDPISLSNDVALVKIPSVNFTNNISPIPLATNVTKSYSNMTAVTSGWGYTNISEIISPVLNYVNVHVIKGNNSSSTICISPINGSSVCRGDSEGPLAIQSLDGKFTLIGVTSYKFSRLCIPGINSCSSRVTFFLPWMKKVTGLNF